MNCVVIDDEPLARKGMQLLIEQVPKLHLSAMFSNALAADDFLINNPVDILFLDIQMPGLTGMEYIKSRAQKAKVIITTAYPQFAVEAFELEVADYLVKPIRFERFYKAVSRIMANTGKQELSSAENEYVFIRSERKYIRTHWNEIDYIEGLKDYVIVHCGAEKYTVAANLKTITAGLPSHLFMRINKSFVINVSKIRSIDNEYVLIGSKELPIGENFKKQLLDFLKDQKILKRN